VQGELSFHKGLKRNHLPSVPSKAKKKKLNGGVNRKSSILLCKADFFSACFISFIT
jgi:hypothetical protein